jgi:uncharacterized membrane protein
MPNTKGLPLGDAIQFGWATLQKHFGFVVGATVAAWGIPMIIWASSRIVLDSDAQHFAMSLISSAVAATLLLGVFKIYLRLRDGEKPSMETLMDGVQRFYVWIGAAIVMGVAVALGLVLLVVPGLIMLIRLMFVGFVIVDERVGPIEAIQRSWDATRGYTLDLFLLFILLCGLNFLGLLCLGIGLIVTIPMSGLAMAFIYRILRPRAAGAGVTTTPAAGTPA